MKTLTLTLLYTLLITSIAMAFGMSASAFFARYSTTDKAKWFIATVITLLIMFVIIYGLLNHFGVQISMIVDSEFPFVIGR